MIKKISITIFLISIILTLQLFAEAETESSKTQIDSLTVENIVDSVKLDSTKTINDSVSYYADDIFFEVLKKKITLRNNSQISYKNSVIYSDTLLIDQENAFIFSNGSIKMQDMDNIILGDKLKFDFDKKDGIVVQGATKFDKGFCYGTAIRKISEDIYDIDNGIFTTCEAKYPHFYIKAKKMRYYNKDKVMGKPLVFYVNHFPIFAFPFGTFSMKRGREAGFLMPKPGYNSREGKYVKDISFYLPLADYADLLWQFDFKEKRGWEAKFSANYKKRYNYNGSFYSRFQRNFTENIHLNDEWYLKLLHYQNLSQESNLNANLNFVSSKRIFSANESIEDRTQSDIASDFYYSRKIFKRNLSVYGRYNENLNNNQKNLTLPKIAYSFPSKQIGDFFKEDYDFLDNLRYSYRINIVHAADINTESSDLKDLFFENKKDSTGYVNFHKAGIGHLTSLSYNTKLAWLSLSQSISYQEGWFERDKNENRIVRGYSYSTRTSANFSLYGIKYFPQNNYLSAIRHILKPTANFSYNPDFSDNNKFYSFSGVSVSSGNRSRNFSFGLSNKWSIKLPSNKFRKKEKKINNFFSTYSSISFDLEKEGDRFTKLRHTYQLNPYKASDDVLSYSLSHNGNFTQNSYNFEIEKYTMDNSFTISGNATYKDYFPEEKNKFEQSRFIFNDTIKTTDDSLSTPTKDETEIKENWTYSISHQLSKDLISNDITSNYCRNSLSFRLTQNWNISYDNYYDIKDKTLQSQSVNLTRDLHCWKIKFSWEKTKSYWSYNINFFNIKLPDTFKIDNSGSGGNY